MEVVTAIDSCSCLGLLFLQGKRHTVIYSSRKTKIILYSPPSQHTPMCLHFTVMLSQPFSTSLTNNVTSLVQVVMCNHVAMRYYFVIKNFFRFSQALGIIKSLSIKQRTLCAENILLITIFHAMKYPYETRKTCV